MNNLKTHYNQAVIPKLMEEFSYQNKHQIPKLEKIQVSAGLGLNAQNRAYLQKATEEIRLITGQHPIVTLSKKSIAGFKLRENLEIAAVVTLRKEKMWDFLERFIYLSLPRSRDFQGISPKSIDKNGNLSMGFKEHISFPEIYSEKEKTIFGLEITVVINAKNKEEGLELYKLMGFPMKETK